MPQIDFDGANSLVKTDKIQGQGGTTVTVPTGHTVAITDADRLTIAGTAVKAGGNKPVFNVVTDNAAEISNTTWTKLIFDSEILDSNSAFDAASNYRFTVPANEAGNYFFHCTVDIQETADHDDVRLNIYKNGSAHMLSQLGRFHYYDTATLTTMLSLVATDYVEMYIHHTKGSNMTVAAGDTSNRGTRWCGFKLSGT